MELGVTGNIVSFLELHERVIITRVCKSWRKISLSTEYRLNYVFYYYFNELESSFFESLKKRWTIKTHHENYQFIPGPHPNFKSYHFSIKVQSVYHLGEKGLIESPNDIGIFIGKNVYYDDSPNLFFTNTDNPSREGVRKVIHHVFQYWIDKKQEGIQRYTLQELMSLKIENSLLTSIELPFVLQKFVSLFHGESEAVKRHFIIKMIGNSVRLFPKYFNFDPKTFTLQYTSNKVVSKGFLCSHDVKRKYVQEYRIDPQECLVDGPFEWTDVDMDTSSRLKRGLDNCCRCCLDVPLLFCLRIVERCVNGQMTEYEEID